MAKSLTFESPLSDAIVELVAARFRVMGEPMRIRLLDALRSGDKTVGELVDASGANQQNVSKHLDVLFQAGIVDRAKEGTRTRYWIADQSVFDICEAVCGGLEKHFERFENLLEGAAR